MEDQRRGNTEFLTFLASNVEPDMTLNSAVNRTAGVTLAPATSKTFAKALCLYFFGSLLTISLCPQFGIAFTGQTVIMDTLMSIHPVLCFLACGMIWAAGGQLLGAFVLSWDERLLLRRHQITWGLSVLTLSMLGFASFGELKADVWLGIWVGGAVLAGMAFWFIAEMKLRPFRVSSLTR